MAKIIIVISDDWEGIYVNNELVYEGHRIDRIELVNVMKEFNTFDVEEQWLNHIGVSLVEKLGNLPNEYEYLSLYLIT